MDKSKFTSKWIALLSISLILGFSAVTTFAQGNLRLGRLTVQPILKYELLYDDNIFLESTNTQEDFINKISPGILIGYAASRPQNYFQIGYNGDFALYVDFTDNDWQRHNPFVRFGYYSPKGLYFNFSDNYTRGNDPFGTVNEFNQSNQFGIGEKTKRWDNGLDATLGYLLTDKYFTEVSYRNYIIRYDTDKDKWQDRTDNAFGLALFYRVTPRTSILAQYRYLSAVYDSQNDGIFDPGRDTNWSSDTSQDYYLNQLFIGARFEPGGKLFGELKLGYGGQNYENSADPQGFKYEENPTWIANTYLTYRPRARTTFVLNFQRSQLGSPDADAASFINTLAQLRLIQVLAYRLSLNIGAGVSYDDYQNEPSGIPEKNFTRPMLDIGLDWLIRPWLTVGMKYDYINNMASDEIYESQEYKRNSVGVFVRATY